MSTLRTMLEGNNTNCHLSILLTRPIYTRMISVPTLQRIALIKVAIGVYSSSEVIKLETHEETGPFHTTPNEAWEAKIRENISSLLPEALLEKVIHLMKPLSLQHSNWISDHSFVIKPSIPAMNYFCWTMGGTIDWFKTAKKLFHLNDLNLLERFVLGCTYCLTDDLITLWMNASSAERFNLIHPLPLTSEGLFTFRKREMFQRYFNCLDFGSRPFPSVLNVYRIYPHIPFQYSFLGVVCLDDVVKYLEEQDSSREDKKTLHFLAKTNTDFTTQYFKVAPVTFLSFFLDWPLQTSFNDMAKVVWNRLVKQDFAELLKRIVHKIENNWRDFDYLLLLNNCWEKGAGSFKTYVRNQPNLQHIMRYVSM